MDKSTLSNYGWIVIAVLVLAVMIALATPFGNYVKAGVESTTAGLFDTSEKAMNVVDMSAGNGSFDGGSGETGTQTPTEPETPSNPIPEGATYTKADGTVLNAGDSFPETVANNDTYTYGDYKYTYATASSGWKVAINTAVTDKKQISYGTILESINGQPVTTMSETFWGCTSLTTAPEIPNSVTNMGSTFQACTSLIKAPKIPSGVKYMAYTFAECTSLTTAPAIPNSVTNMSHTFAECTSLTTAPTIPDGVKNMKCTFYDCTALTGKITINANPAEWSTCLYNTKITKVVGTTTMAASILKTKTSTATNPTA